MGRPKKRGPEKEARAGIGAIRGSHEFAEWVRELATSERLTVSTLLEHALIKYARDKGFREAPNR